MTSCPYLNDYPLKALLVFKLILVRRGYRNKLFKYSLYGNLSEKSASEK